MSSDFRCENNTEIISPVNSKKYCCTCSRTKRRNFVVPSVAPLQQTSFFTLSNIQLKILILVLKKPALAIDHFLYFTDVEGNILHIVAAFDTSVTVYPLGYGARSAGGYRLNLLQNTAMQFIMMYYVILLLFANFHYCIIEYYNVPRKRLSLDFCWTFDNLLD